MIDLKTIIIMVIFLIGLICGWGIADAGLDTKCESKYDEIKEECFKECGLVNHNSGIHFIKCTNEC